MKLCSSLVLLVCALTLPRVHCDDLMDALQRDLQADRRSVSPVSRGTPDDDTCGCQMQIDSLSKVVTQLARQVMLQQLFVEERIRSDGASGIKQSRLGSQGTKPYHATTYVDRRFASIHEHANNIRVVGMGEFIAVLNGVEFRTRHNDYKLVQPSTSTKNYGATEDIPYPEVPPEVTRMRTVEEQITEMREWFRAWRDQDHSVRDYRKYFKPVLCYLEGAWTVSEDDSIDESFDSDRHFLDASSWLDLQEKVRLTPEQFRAYHWYIIHKILL